MHPCGLFTGHSCDRVVSYVPICLIATPYAELSRASAQVLEQPSNSGTSMPPKKKKSLGKAVALGRMAKQMSGSKFKMRSNRWTVKASDDNSLKRLTIAIAHRYEQTQVRNKKGMAGFKVVESSRVIDLEWGKIASYNSVYSWIWLSLGKAKLDGWTLLPKGCSTQAEKVVKRPAGNFPPPPATRFAEAAEQVASSASSASKAAASKASKAAASKVAETVSAAKLSRHGGQLHEMSDLVLLCFHTGLLALQ